MAKLCLSSISINPIEVLKELKQYAKSSVANGNTNEQDQSNLPAGPWRYDRINNVKVCNNAPRKLQCNHHDPFGVHRATHMTRSNHAN